MVPTIDLVTVSDIWSMTIQDRLVYHNIQNNGNQNNDIQNNYFSIMAPSKTTFTITKLSIMKFSIAINKM